MATPLHELSAQHVRALDPGAVAEIPLLRLDWVWLYTPGTVCNLACRHCLTLSSPTSRVLLPLETREVAAALQEVRAAVAGAPVTIGMTGGEVLLLDRARYGHRLYEQVELALDVGDVLILTNALLPTDDGLARLKRIEEGARHSLGFRISLDGASAEENDAIRTGVDGAGTFARILQALPRFVNAGFTPTIAYTYDGEGSGEAVTKLLQEIEARYAEVLERAATPGLELWGIPLFDQGSEFERRDAAGIPHIGSPGLTNDCISRHTGHAFHDFQCAYSRAFAKEPDGRVGWYKCAILPGEGIEPGSRVSTHLAEALRPIELSHDPCITCFRAATQGTPMSCGGR